jgi:hypothetical protein
LAGQINLVCGNEDTNFIAEHLLQLLPPGLHILEAPIVRHGEHQNSRLCVSVIDIRETAVFLLPLAAGHRLLRKRCRCRRWLTWDKLIPRPS